MEKNADLIGKTCANCKYGKLSANLPQCVACLKEDKEGNRFPRYVKNEEA